jgi:hypothetical protein
MPAPFRVCQVFLAPGEDVPDGPNVDVLSPAPRYFA